MKIQWEIMYNRCIDCMNIFKNLNSLNIQNGENSMEIFVH